MNKQKAIGVQRQRRRYRVRKRVQGSAECPRLSVFRSLKHVGAQLIDDSTGRTLASACTLDRDLREQFRYGGNCEAAASIGKILAERALAAGIQSVRFDRGHHRYHGRVAALADAAREGGLQF